MVTVLGFWLTALQQLQALREVAQKYPPEQEITGQDRRFIVGWLFTFGQACHRLDFKASLLPLRYIISVPDFEKTFDYESFANRTIKAGAALLRLNQFEENLHHDGMLRFMLPIPEDRLNYFDGGLSGKFKAPFPSAVEDIDEAGKCYATGRHRAAVFHMIRAAEWALKALAKAAGVKGHVDYKEWGKIINKLEEQVALVDRWPSGPEKANALAFYRGALADARSLNNVWRTANLHAKPGVTCDQHDALKALDRGIDFMSRVATRVSESQKRPLSRRSFRQ
ncbi:MAG: hypothetical protein WD690_08385 [Vicinamibacterales bacterium]